MLNFLVLFAIISKVLSELPGDYLQEYASAYDNYKPRDYHYSYGVADPHTGDHKSQWEIRENGVVRGAYSLLEPDGTTRLVEYVADDNGFRAVVKKLPGENQHNVPIIPQAVPLLAEVPEATLYGKQLELITTKIDQEIPIIPQAELVSPNLALNLPVSILANIPEFSSYSGQLSNYLNSKVPTEAISSIALPETASLIANVPEYNSYNWKLENSEQPTELYPTKQEVPQIVYDSKQLVLPAQLFANKVESPELSYEHLYNNNLNNNYRTSSVEDYHSIPTIKKPAYSHQSFSMQQQDFSSFSGYPNYASNNQYGNYDTAFSHKVYHVAPAPLAKRSTKV